ncbi:hypothetical protein SADUNF_Sadunf03G0134200 [Salix dunnii]|uniref:NADH dehydrogenase [ubiquinone] 1 alpha subcomplex subunit 13 n=1 Tax=Salix dunnii TaxID=1413687 RepID=A0A835N4P5_9ROSI|nr:hypothetical protein SADUNF_Sadunf03G0134200 [Salix dunnii]
MTEAVIRNKPGMASVKDMPILQDGPPPGGFAPVRFARRIPNKGPSAMAIFLAAFGAFSYGMYQVGQGNKVRRLKKFRNTLHGTLELTYFDCGVDRIGEKVKGCSCERASVLLRQSKLHKGHVINCGFVFKPFAFFRALKEEKYAARRAILPLLQAEEDERFVKEWNKYLEYEAEVMKDVPGWKVGQSVYNSGRWMPPATGELRPEVW